MTRSVYVMLEASNKKRKKERDRELTKRVKWAYFPCVLHQNSFIEEHLSMEMYISMCAVFYVYLCSVQCNVHTCVKWMESLCCSYTIYSENVSICSHPVYDRTYSDYNITTFAVEIFCIQNKLEHCMSSKDEWKY